MDCDLVPLLPRRPTPPLEAPLAGGGRFHLRAERPKLMTLIAFYRGLHCMQCRDYIIDLDAMLPELEARGVSTLAISGDARERAERTHADWGLRRLRIAYDLTPDEARSWGLFLTHGRPRAEGMPEPRWYSEPGLFLVEPDGNLFFSCVQNMPFARPRISDLIDGLEFLFARGYFRDKPCPARGEVVNVAELANRDA